MNDEGRRSRLDALRKRIESGEAPKPEDGFVKMLPVSFEPINDLVARFVDGAIDLDEFTDETRKMAAKFDLMALAEHDPTKKADLRLLAGKMFEWLGETRQ